MYLWILKVSRLGKFCGQRTRVIKVLEKVKNFENVEKLAARSRPSTMVTARKACRDECSLILLDIAKEF